MTPQTHTVESYYKTRDGQHRVFVKGFALPLSCEEEIPQGASVIVQGKTARRPS